MIFYTSYINKQVQTTLKTNSRSRFCKQYPIRERTQAEKFSSHNPNTPLWTKLTEIELTICWNPSRIRLLGIGEVNLPNTDTDK